MLSIRSYSAPVLQSADPYWLITNPSSSTHCERNAYNSRYTCELQGVGPWTLTMFDQLERGTFNYQLRARRVTDPEGCSPLGEPEAWSFASARLNGTIDNPLDARCYTFSRTAGENDGAYWFRAARTGGSLNPYWTIYGPSGADECIGSGGDPSGPCRLTAAGEYVAVLENPYGIETGSYFFTSKRLTEPLGCGSLKSTAFGAEPVSGSISTSGEIDCFAIPSVSSGDQVSVSTAVSGVSSGNPRWSIINGSGDTVCSGYAGNGQSDCSLTGPEGWHLLIYDNSGIGSFGYSATVRRTTDPEGCLSLGTPEAWSYSAPRKNGSISSALAAQCYTFSRSDTEEDGAYWIRTLRTSGSLQPAWRVYGPSGSRECSGAGSGPEQACRLIAGGQFALVVSDNGGEQTGSYLLSAKRLTQPQGCTPLVSTAFGSPPENGEIETAGGIDCYSVPASLAGHAAIIGLHGANLAAASPAWALVNQNGSVACSGPYWQPNLPCELPGSGERSLLVFDSGGTGTFEYDLAMRRLTNPQGCSALGEPAAWSFGAPRLTGLVTSDLDSHCYTFTRQVGEPDGRYWIRTLRTSGTLEPRWNIYSPTGSRECGGYSGANEPNCDLRGSGTHALVVEDGNGSGTGEYSLTPRKLNDAQGCSALPSIVFGIPATFGDLSVRGEIDCYSLPATDGDELGFELSGAANAHPVFNQDGSLACSYYLQDCTLSGQGPFSLAVYSTGGDTGSYKLQAKCENVPCGQVDTALTEATPKRLGQGRFTTLLLRGHDLDLMDKVSLVRGGTEIEGELQEATGGARALEVRFDLREAATGSWTVQGHFLDGSTKLLNNAITVEPAHEGEVSLQTLGRETFRAGVANPITIVASNPGNVDAVAVPIVLRGLPSGAVITPSFDLYSPNGNEEGVTFSKTSFNQTTETLTENGEIIAPFLISRIPAGRSVTMELSISVSSVATYQLHVFAGRCLASEVSAESGAVTAGVHTAAASSDGVNCGGDIAAKLLGKATGALWGSCGKIASNAVVQAAVDAGGGNKFWSWGHVANWLANGALCAGEVLVPESKLIRASLDALNAATTLSGQVNLLADCLTFASQAAMQQRVVVSIDPNEIEGPAGVGAQRYIQANVPLSYQVLFENLPQATAAAQKVTVVDELDPDTFQPSTVLFSGVGFGSTYYQPPYPTDSLDTIVDLRPQQNLEVHVTAEVSGNLMRLELEALDPNTSQPPEDPNLGVLPPNVEPPEGEGRLLFTVAPQQLPSGATIANSASIQFDQNTPIGTETWTNVVDKQPPQPTLKAEGQGADLHASVSWGGTDDAAGIDLWHLEVSRDGGPFELWRTATAPGSADFEAPAAGSYNFRAVAYDGAGNSGQSSLAGITLSEPPASEPPSGGSGDSSPPSATTAPAAGEPAPTPTPRRQHRCKKGFKKKRVHGKIRCVRIKHRH